jgi:hypothetical protein
MYQNMQIKTKKKIKMNPCSWIGSLPPSVSPPQSYQQPPSPSNIPHPSPAWSPSPQTLSPCLRLSQAPPFRPGPCKCCSMRCKGPSRLVLMAQSIPDALSSIISLSVQLTSQIGGAIHCHILNNLKPWSTS